MWDTLQNLIPYVAGKYNMTNTLKAIEICREYRRLAPRVLPGESLLNTAPKSYKDKTLTIVATSSGWAEQIQRNSHIIKREINEKYGENTVKRIRIESAQSLPAGDF
jgi:hypothetical protein